MAESRTSVIDRLLELKNRIREKNSTNKSSTRIQMLIEASAIKRIDAILVKLNAKGKLDEKFSAEIEEAFSEYDKQYDERDKNSKRIKGEIRSLRKELRDKKRELGDLTDTEDIKRVEARHSKFAERYGNKEKEEIDSEEAGTISELETEIKRLEEEIARKEKELEGEEIKKLVLTDGFEQKEKELQKKLREQKLNLIIHNEKGNIFKRIGNFFGKLKEKYDERKKSKRDEAQKKLEAALKGEEGIDARAEELAERAQEPGIRETLRAGARSLKEQAEGTRNFFARKNREQSDGQEYVDGEQPELYTGEEPGDDL